MANDDRRQVLRTGARYLIASALGALAISLGLRKGEQTSSGYCDQAGRCGGCEVTADCDVYQVTHQEKRP
jgi:hypothetical protein